MIYLGWYAPRAFLKTNIREGPINYWLTGRGRKAMKRAAWQLRPAQMTAAPDAPAVHFLTGSKFWYQTAFCAHSLLTHAGRPLRLVVIDDGTLTEKQAAALARALPGLEIVWAADIMQRLDKFLPATRFPVLRQRRLVYPHLRKLTDVHAGETGWKLVLDSDMLFHGCPIFLLDWLTAPDRPCHMVDIENAYGYSAKLMNELVAAPIPERLNVGICGLRSDAIDWCILEHWCRTMLEREGSHYLQEQALTAMLASAEPRAAAPSHQYVVRPTRAETERPTAILHHYVAESKAWYFRFAWQRFRLIGECRI